MKLDGVEIGEGQPCYVIAELGINHNGSADTAHRMIDAAALAGANAVKLQLRDVETVYTRAPYPTGYLDQPREHPLGGEQTQRGQKLALELTLGEHAALIEHARRLGLGYSVSAWDELSLRRAVALGLSWLKVASPILLDGPLMRAHAATGLPLVISTGGLDLQQLFAVIEGLPLCAQLHCCSTYPAEDDDLNLRAIEAMRDAFDCPIGYSGHERGIATSVAAVVLGASIVERHFTLDRSSYGSDQAASLEPPGLTRLVRDIRAVERALGDGVKRPRSSEAAALVKMRRVVE